MDGACRFEIRYALRLAGPLRDGFVLCWIAFGACLNTVSPQSIESELMNKSIASAMIAFALTFSARAADSTVKISGVHLCCKSCVTGVEKAVAEVRGASVSVDKDAGTVELTGSDVATVQKAADALVAAGYYGTSSDPKIKITGGTGAEGKKVQLLQVNGVHLCCGKCVTSVDEALKSVSGVKSHTAVKGAKSFEITGDFNDKEVFGALQRTGLTGQAGK
jgi:periplasmic mercuric ion binding protein